MLFETLTILAVANLFATFFLLFGRSTVAAPDPSMKETLTFILAVANLFATFFLLFYRSTVVAPDPSMKETLTFILAVANLFATFFLLFDRSTVVAPDPSMKEIKKFIKQELKPLQSKRRTDIENSAESVKMLSKSFGKVWDKVTDLCETMTEMQESDVRMREQIEFLAATIVRLLAAAPAMEPKAHRPPTQTTQTTPAPMTRAAAKKAQTTSVVKRGRRVRALPARLEKQE